MYVAMQTAIERAIAIVGSQDALAKAVGVTQSLVSQWNNGETAVHVRHFPQIEKATGSKVTRAELLADEIDRDRRLRSA